MASSRDLPISQAITTDLSESGYKPSEAEEKILNSMRSQVIKMGSLGFATGLLSMHVFLKLVMKDKLKQAGFAMRFGGPIAIGGLAGVGASIFAIKPHLQALAYDLPPTPLTNIYRARFVRTRRQEQPANDSTAEQPPQNQETQQS